MLVYNSLILKKTITMRRKKARNKRKKKSWKAPGRPKKGKRKKKKKRDPNAIEDEYDLQKHYNSWYTDTYPYVVSCGTPYASMSIYQAAKAKAKGYTKGYPDYVEHDPRFIIQQNRDLIRIKFIPGRFIEFKTPKGKGIVSKEQTQVKKALERRGYVSEILNDYNETIEKTKQYKKEATPYYNGWITINKRNFKINIPKSTRKVTVPGRSKRIRKTSRSKSKSGRRPKVRRTISGKIRKKNKRKRGVVKKRKTVKIQQQVIIVE